jgi:hypothetical protein
LTLEQLNLDRYSIGQLFATTALKVLSNRDPTNYLDLIYSEWAMLVSDIKQVVETIADRNCKQGIMMAIYIYIPESPCETEA